MIKSHYRRKPMRSHPTRQPEAWRRRKPEEVLPDLSGQLGTRPGSQRCVATNLTTGDCKQARMHDSGYCFYHEKLRLGLMEPSGELYPVWPLPVGGYVLLRERQEAA